MTWRENKLAARAADSLGEPDRVFHISRTRSIAIVAFAVLLILWGIVGSYLWFAVLNAGAKALKGYALLVVIPAGIGATLLYRTSRTRGLTVLTYPTGILVANRSDVFSFPWDEIVEIRLGNVHNPIIDYDMTGQIASLVLPGRNTFWYGGLNSLMLTTSDGRTGEIPVAITGFRELTIRVQRETAEHLWPMTMERFRAGEPLTFGPDTAHQDQLQCDSRSIPWNEIGSAVVVSTNLVVRRKAGLFKHWHKLAISEIPNPHVFLRLLLTMIDHAGSLRPATNPGVGLPDSEQ
jgi:hypothetical protein